MDERARGIAVAVVSAAAFLALSMWVASGEAQPHDANAREFFRPGNEWGLLQIRADLVVEGLKPRNALLVLGAVGLAVSLVRSSWRPAVYVAAIGAVTVGLTVGAKLALSRPDTHHHVGWAGGSFPSGHTVALLVCAGGIVLVLRERSRWWQWVGVGLAGAGMGLALLVQAAHWLTDVIGALPLATTVLAVASLSGLRRTGPSKGSETADRGPSRAD